MPTLIETVAAELERPRELSSRVLNYIRGTYSVDDDAMGSFLTGQLPKLEDDEIDLILSPLFTPKLSDQAVVAAVLNNQSISRSSSHSLVQELASRPTHAQLVTPDAQVHRIQLREVSIERYVHRLRLEGSIPESVLKMIDGVPSAADHPLLKAIARRSIWESETRGILEAYLRNAIDRGSYHIDDAVELLNLVESRKPANLPDLLARIPRWQETLREQVVAGGAKPFFNEDVRLLHGGGRDQRGTDVRMSAKERDLDFLYRLQKILEPLP